MTWFAASIIVTMRPIEKSSEPILVYENVVLIEAADSDEAWSKATVYATASIVADESLTVNEKPAVEKFVGIRKLINISNPSPLDLDKDAPVNGTEVTYSVFEVASEEDLAKLAAGDDVAIRYVE